MSLQFERKRYMILFNIDGSSSMEGSRWKSVTESINSIIGNLNGEDLVAAIVFNNEPRLITAPSFRIANGPSSPPSSPP